MFAISVTTTLSTSVPTVVGMSGFTTTGSIEAGSDTLQVADASGLNVGDWVIVEIGGEAGGGERGTRGVGGTWPTLSYPDEATMQADQSQAGATSCWIEDTGDVWTYFSSWVKSDFFYTAKAVPRALSAEILARSGNTLTLDKPASVAATNANVHFDNWGVLHDAISASSSVTMPAGTFAMSCHLAIENKTGLTISGAGQELTTLKTPAGAGHGGMTFRDGSDCIVQNLTIDCGFRNYGFGFNWTDNRVGAVATIHRFDNINSTTARGRGVFFYGTQDSEARDVTIKNPGINGFGCQYTFDSWARRVTVRVEDPYPSYVQWMIQIPDCWGGGAEDCYVDADWMVPGYESFKSQNVTFRRCRGRNTLMSSNSSSNFTVEDCEVIIEEGRLGSSNFITKLQPLFNVNSNAPGGFNELPINIINSSFIQLGYPDLANPFRFGGVQTSGSSAGLNITGTYDTDPVNPKGLFRWDAAHVNGAGDEQGIFIKAAMPLTVKGIRLQGAPTPWGSIKLEGDPGPVTSVTNSILDAGADDLAVNGSTGNLTQSGNMTNAEYEAG